MRPTRLSRLIGIVVLFFVVNALTAQKTDRVSAERCGTMQSLQMLFQRDPQFKILFEKERDNFNSRLAAKSIQTASTRNAASGAGATARTVYTIPIVFHIVLADPNSVTDAQIQAQLDTLNKDYAGANGDSVNIPSWFKPLFGKSAIRFCLAQRTPDGLTTTGIERVVTTQTAFSNSDNAVKHVSMGGADSWDNTAYYNVWVCPLSGSLLGYATFPASGSDAEQGVVIEYRSLPGGAYTNYNTGKTLSHETGHYFNLYHIWGDDNGACTGTDYVDDTPNQGNSTSGCYSGIHLDNCTTSGDGIMYQNYMDYSTDDCMALFTTEQVTRMESALLTYRSSLLTALSCQPVNLKNYDIALSSIGQPAQRICSATLTPVINIRNIGSQVITTLTITASIDGGSPVTTSWTGSLAYAASTAVTLNNMTVTEGIHTLTVTTSLPDGQADQNVTNDAASVSFQYYAPVSAVSEGFETATFPPVAWDILNPDNSTTWQRVTSAAKTGSGSSMIDNFDYSSIGQQDYLRLPQMAITGVDSAFFDFQVAAATYTAIGTSGNSWDTLEVLLSQDCGNTYTSLYKKYGAALVTRTAATTTAFVPTASEWRKDSINLGAYIGAGEIMLAFRNTTGNENNIYLDDINLRTVTINPNLKKQGFLLTPNPTGGPLTVQFYPPPTNLQSIGIYSVTGQRILEDPVIGKGNSLYSFNLGSLAAATYFIRIVYSDKVVTRKIVKY